MIETDSSLFHVDIENYSGPLNVLLDLAKAKVNLEEISITKLADQFNDFIKNEKFKFRRCFGISFDGNMVSVPKIKITLPETPEEEFKVLEVAEKLKLQLKKLELIRLLSEQMLKEKDWVEK